MPRKHSPHHYTGLGCWHKASWVHVVMLLLPGSGPTICLRRSLDSLNPAMFFCPRLISLCPQQPQISGLDWQERRLLPSTLRCFAVIFNSGCVFLYVVGTEKGGSDLWSHTLHLFIYVHIDTHQLHRELRWWRKETPCPLGHLSLSCALNQPPAASGLKLTSAASQGSHQVVSSGYLPLLNVPQKHFKAILKMPETAFCTYSMNIGFSVEYYTVDAINIPKTPVALVIVPSVIILNMNASSQKCIFSSSINFLDICIIPVINDFQSIFSVCWLKDHMFMSREDTNPTWPLFSFHSSPSIVCLFFSSKHFLNMTSPQLFVHFLGLHCNVFIFHLKYCRLLHC